MKLHPLVAACLLLPAGCAGTGEVIPSLAPRIGEALTFDEPVRPPGTVVADPALDAQLAALTTRLDAIANGFSTAAREAEDKARLARGRPTGSEPWLEAQTTIATLDDWRAQASALDTDIEQLEIARAASLAPPYPALATLTERAEVEARTQSEAITRLQAQLAPA